jgi:hypothetical protein
MLFTLIKLGLPSWLALNHLYRCACITLFLALSFVSPQAGISLRMVRDSDSDDKTKWMLVSWRLCLNWQESESHIPTAKRRSIVKPEQIQNLMEAVNARSCRKSEWLRIVFVCIFAITSQFAPC